MEIQGIKSESVIRILRMSFPYIYRFESNEETEAVASARCIMTEKDMD